jgi:hypothetical protein
MDSRDFLKLAEQLVVARTAGAAHFRTAIGRAYYGAFNFGSQILDQLGFPPAENAHGHNQTVRLFQQSGDPELEAAAGLLGDLHTLRLKADYNLKRTEVEKMKVAQAAVESADSIFDDLNAFLSDPARRSAVTATLGPRYRSLTGKPNP